MVVISGGRKIVAVSVSVTVHDGVRDGRRLRLGFRLGVARLGPKRTRRRVVAEGIIVAPRVDAVCRPVEKTVRVRGGVIFVVVVDRDVVLVNLVRLWGGRRAADGARRLLRRAPPRDEKGGAFRVRRRPGRNGRDVFGPA